LPVASLAAIRRDEHDLDRGDAEPSPVGRNVLWPPVIA
jgi:hypothetical protein